MFFFFKQKTAYEMRISDWSSDVCSSDLLECRPSSGKGHGSGISLGIVLIAAWMPSAAKSCISSSYKSATVRGRRASILSSPRLVRQSRRSEEHTSELQSLMRISYAVFCLKKNTQHEHTTPNILHNKTPAPEKSNNLYSKQ